MDDKVLAPGVTPREQGDAIMKARLAAADALIAKVLEYYCFPDGECQYLEGAGCHHEEQMLHKELREHLGVK